MRVNFKPRYVDGIYIDYVAARQLQVFLEEERWITEEEAAKCIKEDQEGAVRKALINALVEEFVTKYKVDLDELALELKESITTRDSSGVKRVVQHFKQKLELKNELR